MQTVVMVTSSIGQSSCQHRLVKCVGSRQHRLVSEYRIKSEIAFTSGAGNSTKYSYKSFVGVFCIISAVIEYLLLHFNYS